MRFVLIVVLAACSSERAPAKAVDPAPAPAVRRPPPGPISTVTAADYIGPDACAECHPAQHAAWKTSLHAVMNQRATPTSVIGDFTGKTVAYAGGTARFDRDREGFTMTLEKAARRTRYRITRTIGVRGLQEYVGVIDGSTEEVRLPFAWWPRRAGWYPQPFFDPWFAREEDFDAYAPVTEPWAERCPWCHSTYPFVQRIARATARPVGHGLAALFIAPAGSDRLAVDQQITAGISCESCHLGGRAHEEGAPISFVPQGVEARPGAPSPSTFAQERADPAIVNRVCAQCHSGPSPRLADGTALRNSSEALDLAASECTTARCTDCHDPHTGGSSEARAIAACTSCHPQLADPAAAAAHGGHRAATCLDCHMPKLVMGIDRVVRTHRISSPTNPAILATNGPNACNLCHVDRSLQWTLDELAARYEVRLRIDASDRPMGDVWLTSTEPALRLLAADAYAHSSLATLVLPALVEQLADRLPHVRTWAAFAVETVTGRPIHRGSYVRGATRSRSVLSEE